MFLEFLLFYQFGNLFTVLYGGKALKVGRVQTPTLAMLVDRESKIMNFKKEAYYMAHIMGNGLDAVSEHISDKTEAERIAMKFWMKRWLDFPNALMYGIGHGGVEAILIGGLSGISNLVSMLMINSGAMQNTLAALPAESANQTVSQLSALWTTPAPLFFVSGIERISAIILHIGLSLLIYRAVKAGKCRTAAFTAVLAYGIHFIVDFFAVAGPALLPIYVIEIGVFVMAAGTLVMELKMGRMEEL